jgi:hypothetical protein
VAMENCQSATDRDEIAAPLILSRELEDEVDRHVLVPRKRDHPLSSCLSVGLARSWGMLHTELVFVAMRLSAMSTVSPGE